MDKLVQSGRKQNVVAFIATCANLFKDNTMFASASTQWRSRSTKFTFEFDSIPKIVRARGRIRASKSVRNSVTNASSRRAGRAGVTSAQTTAVSPTATTSAGMSSTTYPLRR